MIDKSYITVQRTGLYELAILEWNRFDPVNKTWPDFKANFGKAWYSCLRLGVDTANTNGYHCAANATDLDLADNDSISSILERVSAPSKFPTMPTSKSLMTICQP